MIGINLAKIVFQVHSASMTVELKQIFPLGGTD